MKIQCRCCREGVKATLIVFAGVQLMFGLLLWGWFFVPWPDVTRAELWGYGSIFIFMWSALSVWTTSTCDGNLLIIWLRRK